MDFLIKTCVNFILLDENKVSFLVKKYSLKINIISIKIPRSKFSSSSSCTIRLYKKNKTVINDKILVLLERKIATLEESRMEIYLFLFCAVHNQLQLGAWNFAGIQFNICGKGRHIVIFFFLALFCIHTSPLVVFRTTTSTCSGFITGFSLY